MKIAKIDWLDICSATTNWTDLNDLEVSPLQCSSVGYVVKETEDYICIAQNYNESGNLVADTMTFPRSIITNFVYLKDSD